MFYAFILLLGVQVLKSEIVVHVCSQFRVFDHLPSFQARYKILTGSRLQEAHGTNNTSLGINGHSHTAKLEYPPLDNDLR